MCGITGIYRFDGGNVDYSLLKQMTDAVTHRGPDDEGQYIDKNAGFGRSNGPGSDDEILA